MGEFMRNAIRLRKLVRGMLAFFPESRLLHGQSHPPLTEKETKKLQGKSDKASQVIDSMKKILDADIIQRRNQGSIKVYVENLPDKIDEIKAILLSPGVLSQPADNLFIKINQICLD